MDDNETLTIPALPRRKLSIDADDTIQRVIDDYEDDLRDRQDWSDQRLQRYAKYRGWLEHKTQPWDGSSNAHLPMLMTDCQRMIDTLVNAVLTQRPVMGAVAVSEADKDKAKTVDELLDYQFFLEQPGEERLQEWAEGFVVDGTVVAFVPYLTDERQVPDVRAYPPLDPSIPMDVQLRVRLEQAFPGAFLAHTDAHGFAWSVRWRDQAGQDQTATVDWQQDEVGRVIMIATREVRLYDGPCFLPKPLEDIVVPARSANCQMPGPANPGGADHVTMVDYPTVDEIRRLHRQGYYDRCTTEDIDKLDADTTTGSPGGRDQTDPDEHKVQRDTLAGQDRSDADRTGRTLTRLMYFGRLDINDDGLLEDVIVWVLRESRLLLKVCLLAEKFPAMPPRRPFAEARFLPVQGQFYGIGMVEMLEHLHDTMKAILDQTLDKNTLVNMPWFLYRAASGLRPEVIKMAPGEGYPVSNPGQDMAFPQIPNPDQTTSLNLMALLQQWADKQVVIGDLQLGRVPQGKASALRTVGGMMSVLQQGDARPERLLRRFFAGIAQVYQQFHELNQAFLPPKKQYRIASPMRPDLNPYRTLDDPSAIAGRFQFEFKANSLNTNKASQAQILQGLGPTLFNAMTFQMGLATPESFAVWLRKLMTAMGQDPHELLPDAVAGEPTVTIDQVAASIMQGRLPVGKPKEGPARQLQMIQAFLATPDAAFLDRGAHILIEQWTRHLASLQQQQQQMAMLAQSFAQMQSGGGGGAQAMKSESGGGDGMTMAQQGPGQLNDESLPSAGGGANTGMMA